MYCVIPGRRIGAALAIAALLAGCGGGGGGNGGGSVGAAPTPAPTPTPTPTAVAGCSLRERQDWLAAQMREWYLFPETLPATLDPSPYASADAYLDALTATARGQRRDRYFTYLTSIAEENAYYNSGATAGFGFRLASSADRTRIYVSEAFEGAPALAGGIDRGAEIVAIGTTPATLRTIEQIAREDGGSLTPALGPDTPGTQRSFRITDAAGTRVVTLAKADYTLAPVSSRYGAKIITDGGRRVGYVNLRTFIGTADQALRDAFAQFRTAGVTDLIVDLRYNGGGLIATAELMNDLLGRNRTTGEVQGYTTFRPEKSARNTQRNFTVQPQSVAPTRIAFIGTGGTASASELVINAFVPYYRTNVALIGSNTYGKPVGQIAIDRSACDDRLRVVAFAVQNSARSAAYFDGLATTMEASCQAGDDLTRPLGDPAEASTRAALDYLAGRPCTKIGASTAQAQRAIAPREALTPDRPSTAQREVPGLF